MMNKKIIIDNNIYDVVTVQDYLNNINIFNPKYTAIEVGDYALPVIPPTILPDKVGIVCSVTNTAMSQVHYPSPEEAYKYHKDNIIDYNSAKDIKQMMSMQESIRNIEDQILVSSDNIFTPKIKENDTKAMRAMKEAIISKNIDINKYEPRFGTNFPNDKRAMNESSITLKKMIRVARLLDMRCTLTIEDANVDIPNPMNKIITVDLTEGEDEE